MKKTKEELINAFNGIIGERTDDDVVSFLENLTDTIDDYANSENENYKKKYEENDKEWRERYMKRFRDGADEEKPVPPITIDPPEPTKEESIKIDDLFKEE